MSGKKKGKKSENRSIPNPVSIMKNHSLPRCNPHRNLEDGEIKEMNEKKGSLDNRTGSRRKKGNTRAGKGTKNDN